jgi:hypothetical protein
MVHLKLLKKQEQAKPKSIRYKEIKEISVEINNGDLKNNTKNQ